MRFCDKREPYWEIREERSSHSKKRENDKNAVHGEAGNQKIFPEV